MKTLSIGDITRYFDNLKKAICTNDGIDLKHFRFLVKVIITDERTDKILACLDIATTLMNNTAGSGVFYHCLVDDIRLISENPDLEKILYKSEKKYANLTSKLIKNGQ
ncbi:hypothetical protein N9U60_03295 [Betaproteobacteria bacterium]|nr:hypothetical protein [Betaproteobacteria bacterium]